MPYQVLARKYRPQRFSDVVGQDHVTRTLLNALAQSRIAHGYIFSGHRGIGKTTIARILAMALNCRTALGAPERPTAEPCGACDSCTEVRAGNAVDVIEIDAATNRGIDEIRELRDAARYRPARDRYKIYILDEAHQITDAAFNALLKTLEEPPDHVVFMMATTQPEDIPQTIRSRCQHFSFHAVKFDDILTQLRTIATEEQVGADDDALALLAEAGDGSMRDALSIMDQAIASAPLVEGAAHLDAAQIRELMGSVPNTVFERLLEAIGENQSAPVIEEVNRLLNAGNSASQLARQFVRYLRNVLMARLAGEQTELLQLSPDERARAARSALLFSEEDLTRFLQVMLRTFDELNYRQEPRFHLELGLLKLVHLQRLLPVEQLLSQIGGAGSAAPPRAGGGPLPGRAGQVPESRVAETPAGSSRAAASEQSRHPAAAPFVSAGPDQERPDKAPAFSPFDTDTRRKGAASAPRTPAMPTPASPVAHTLAADAPARLSPSIAAATGEAPASHASSSLPATSAPQKASPPPLPLQGSGQVRAQEPPAEPGTSDGSTHSHGSLNSQSSGAQVPSPQPRALQSAPPTQVPEEAAAHYSPIENGQAADADSAATAAKPSRSAPGNLDSLRDQVCTALEQAGHNTAAALLGAASWVNEGSTLRVEVAAKKTMLSLTMNAEAEKICREVLRAYVDGGSMPTLTFLPVDGPATSGGRGEPPRPPATGSAQARAMENPLVRQAQELFRAEVRSVLDLRK